MKIQVNVHGTHLVIRLNFIIECYLESFTLCFFVSRGFNYRGIAYFNIAAIAFRGEQNNITTLIARNNFQF